jgi:septal ring factor EnvC (AmiA/AmiB activator)
VVFEPVPQRDSGPETKSREAKADQTNRKTGQASEVARLQDELAATREYMQSLVEQLEAANEELQSANEEIQSSNEELRRAFGARAGGRNRALRLYKAFSSGWRSFTRFAEPHSGSPA